MKDIVEVKNAVDSLNLINRLNNKDYKLLVAHISSDEAICSISPAVRRDNKGILILTNERLLFLSIVDGKEHKWSIATKHVSRLSPNKDKLVVVDVNDGKHLFEKGLSENLMHMEKAFRIVVKEENLNFEIFRDITQKKKFSFKSLFSGFL